MFRKNAWQPWAGDWICKVKVRAKLERTPSCNSESSKPVMVFQDERLGQRWCRVIGIIVNLQLKL